MQFPSLITYKKNIQLVLKNFVINCWNFDHAIFWIFLTEYCGIILFVDVNVHG